MKILAITSGKGGVGKTTVSLNIARQLSLGGLRVLIVDFDIHNKGATCLFMDKVSNSAEAQSITGLTAYGAGFDPLLAREMSEKFPLVDLGFKGRLFLLPAARPNEMIQWSTLVCDNQRMVEFFRVFIQAIAEKNGIDIVLIDCYGGVDTLTIAAAGIADDLIIINEPDVITFAGTLLLYKQLEMTYGSTGRPPQVHFIINRVSSRHSFAFLRQEYQKHLFELAVDRTALAYLPYDKLVFNTFGDYPFFSELLPRGLYAKKIRELIARLWPEPLFTRLTSASARKRQRIYEATAENPFADPERIFTALKTAPFWALLPITAMILLYKGPVQSISFFTLRTLFYMSLIFVSALIFFVVLFEPWQISRWLGRQARYERKRRRLLFGATLANWGRAAWGLVSAWAPRAIGLVCFSMILLLAYGWNLLSPFRNVAIWQRQIEGFSPGTNYNKLVLADNTAIKAGSDLSKCHLREAQLSSTILPQISFEGADMEAADLERAKLMGGQLSGVNLKHAKLSDTDLSGAFARDADFSYASAIGSSFWGADLTDASFTHAVLFKTDFKQSNLRRADFSDAIIKNTEFDGADLTDADFSHADFGYIDADNQRQLFSQLKHQGARLTDDQKKLARDWEKDPERKHDYWWLQWKPSEPAHLHDVVEPRLEVLKFTLALDALRNDYQARAKEASHVDRRSTDSVFASSLPDLTMRAKDFATSSDIIELLIIRGNPEDLTMARKVLDALGKTEFTVDPDDARRNAGVVFLLKALLAVINSDPETERKNTEAWRKWLAEEHNRLQEKHIETNPQLVGWAWNAWDPNFPAGRYSIQKASKIRALRLSATGVISEKEMMLWFIPTAQPSSAGDVLRSEK